MPEYRYRPGDTVMIRPDLRSGDDFGIYVSEAMASMAGCEVTIEIHRGYYNSQPVYLIKEDEHSYHWTEDLFIDDIQWEKFIDNYEPDYEPESLSLLYEWV